jgi:hypothetical protein
MGSCEAQRFDGVTETVWRAVIGRVSAGLGIAIDGPQGARSKDGFTVSWDYRASSEELTIQCTGKPWWAPCGKVNDEIRDLVESCR